MPDVKKCMVGRNNCDVICGQKKKVVVCLPLIRDNVYLYLFTAFVVQICQ